MPSILRSLKQAHLVALLVVFVAPGAGAQQWCPGDVDRGKNDDFTNTIRTINGCPGTDGPLRDLYKQLGQKGELEDLTEIVAELLGVVAERAQELKRFKGNAANPNQNRRNGSNNKWCDSNSTCNSFAGDLVEMTDDFVDLRERVPGLGEIGLDGDLTAEIVKNAPPILLLGLYDVMLTVPDWQNLASKINDLLDQLGIDELAGVGSASASGEHRASAADASPFQELEYHHRDLCDGECLGFLGLGGLYGASAGELFCRQNEILDGYPNSFVLPAYPDRVFINNALAIIKVLALALEPLGELPDDLDIGVSFVGEGASTAIVNPINPINRAIISLLQGVVVLVETHQENVGVCRERWERIEERLGSCSMDTRMISGLFIIDRDILVDDYFRLVERRMYSAVVNSKCNNSDDPCTRRDKKHLEDAERILRQAYGGGGAEDRKSAFENLCLAYSTLGEVHMRRNRRRVEPQSAQVSIDPESTASEAVAVEVPAGETRRGRRESR